jgi:hypothetical protein
MAIATAVKTMTLAAGKRSSYEINKGCVFFGGGHTERTEKNDEKASSHQIRWDDYDHPYPVENVAPWRSGF